MEFSQGLSGRVCSGCVFVQVGQPLFVADGFCMPGLAWQLKDDKIICLLHMKLLSCRSVDVP